MGVGEVKNGETGWIVTFETIWITCLWRRVESLKVGLK